MFRRALAALLAVTSLVAGGVRADDWPPGIPELTACLSVQADGEERPLLTLQLVGTNERRAAVRKDAIERALRAVCGDALVLTNDETPAVSLGWTVPGCPSFRCENHVTYGVLDLAPLLAELRSAGLDQLHLVVSYPPGAGSCTLGGRILSPLTGGPDDGQTFVADLSTTAEQPVLAVYCVAKDVVDLVSVGWPDLSALWPTGPGDPRWLWLLPAVPLGVLLWAWRLRRLARRPDVDTVTLGFRFWRFQNSLQGATWVSWLVTVAVSGAAWHVEPWLGGPGTVARAARWGLLYVLPPLAILLLAQAVAGPALRRLRELGWPLADLTRSAAGLRTLQVAALFLACLGMAATIRDMAPRTGLQLFVAGLVAWVAYSVLARRALQLTPATLTHGELRDRITALAHHFGVPVPEVGVLPTDRTQLVNAFAVANQGVWLTDRLVGEFSRREVDAIVAHELAHLRQFQIRNVGSRSVLPSVVVFSFLLAIVISVSGESLLPAAPFLMILRGLASVPLPPIDWGPLVLAGLSLYAQLKACSVSRRREYDADRRAVEATGDTPALIAALSRLNRLNGLPDTWGRWQGLFLSHPPTSGRIAALARAARLSPKQVAELACVTVGEADRYPLPAETAQQGRVFSPAFRRRILARQSWTVITMVVVLPVLAAALADVLGPGAAADVVLAVGAAAPAVLYVLLVNVLACAGGEDLRRGVLAKLRAEGIDPAEAVFVSFAPGDEPMIYDGFGQWDVGCLFPAADRLVYVGEQTRFALTRAQVVDIRLGPALPGWVQARRVYVTWQDETTGACSTFAVWPGDARSIRHIRRGAAALADRLAAWHAGEGPKPPALPSDLGPPAFGAVHGAAPRSYARPKAVVASLTIPLLLVAGVCALVGLPFTLTPTHGSGYVLAVVAGTLIFPWLPYWLGRGPRRGGPWADAPGA